MTNLRLVLLATTALTVTQLAAAPSHAQTAPLVVAQAAPKEELGPDGKPKPKEAPKGAPPKAAPPAPPAAPPAKPAAPPPPPPPPPPPAPKPAPPAAPPPHVPPPAAPPPPPPPPPHVPPPAAAPPAPPPPHIPPPAAAPPPAAPKPTPTPSPTPTPTPSPTATPQIQQRLEQKLPQKNAPTLVPPTGAKQLPQSPAPTAAPTPTPTPTAPPAGGGAGTPPPGRAGQTPAATPSPTSTPTPTPTAPPTGGGAGTPPPGRAGQAPVAPSATPAPGGAQTALPAGAAPLVRHAPPTVTAPLPPPPPPAAALAPIPQGAPPQGPRRMEDFRAARQESDQGGRRVFTEPGRVIIVDPSGQSFIRHDEDERFRYGARDIRTEQVGGDTRTVVIRPDGSEIITVVGRDGQLLRRIRRDREGREIIIIDNSYRDPAAVGGFYVDLPPPVIRIPYDRYIVEADDAPPDLIYETMEAPPVERIQRRYSLDEIRYSPSVRQLMPSIDLNSINFETGSWDVPPDQAAKLQVIADGLNRAIQRNPREVFLIEGHTDAVGNDVDNLSLSDRRAQSAAELLTQQFGVPAENLTSQGYGAQYLKEQTSGPSRINRRVTVRRITPLLNGGVASLPPPPPGIAPPR
ncbi:OmpA family protein [Bradyrhizobium lablabi]|uniref:OmpA family protein n=1 Tax=Bradyrhizobium lablabi TaxID=722472 RepID=UPI0009A7DE83|nr:OmpA family protein [Bradyrhizobium lablabi]